MIRRYICLVLRRHNIYSSCLYIFQIRMTLIEQIRERAKMKGKTIVLPEGTEERTLKAADFILKEGIAKIILLGSPDQIREKAELWGLGHVLQARIIDPGNHPDTEKFSKELFEIRKHKGLSLEEARELIKDPLYLGVMLIRDRQAHGEVAGAMNTTANVLRPAFQIIKTKPGMSTVSGAFIMILKENSLVKDGMLVFADCAVLPDPNAEELAEIALNTAETARNIAGIEPRVAMLSFSTKGSACHELVEKVQKATSLVKAKNPNLTIDGEMQADAAIVESVGIGKAPGSPVAGKANVLVFPGLEAGNIGYKLVQRLAGAEAVGPILQGMAAPINDLSRGCSVSDIVNMVAITANQSSDF